MSKHFTILHDSEQKMYTSSGGFTLNKQQLNHKIVSDQP